jgi:hypothetical protein
MNRLTDARRRCRDNQSSMTQNGSNIDHIAESVPATSALRDSVAANAGEKLTLARASAQRTAVRTNAVTFCLVTYFFIAASMLPKALIGEPGPGNT